MGEGSQSKKTRRNFILAGLLALGAAVAGLVLGRDYLSPAQERAPPSPGEPDVRAPDQAMPLPELPKKFDQVIGEAIRYPGESGEIVAYEARPISDTQFPAIIVIHENAGLLQHFRNVADRYAGEGIVAVAVDFLSRVGGSSEDDMENRMKQSTISDAMVQSDIDSTIQYLRGRPYVRGDRIAITGFCWGGRQSMIAALRSREIAAGVPYYGFPINSRPSEIQSINPIDLVASSTAPLLAHFGEADRAIPLEQVEQFRKALEDNGKTFELYIYEGAGHAFFNDSRPQVYNEAAAELSWERTIAFLDKHLRT